MKYYHTDGKKPGAINMTTGVFLFGILKLVKTITSIDKL